MPGEILFYTVFLVALPLGLLALGQMVHWRPFRLALVAAAVAWFAGLTCLTLLGTRCEGNFFYGYRLCRGVTEGLADAGQGFGWAGMLGGVALAGLATGVLLLRWLWRLLTDRRGSAPGA